MQTTSSSPRSAPHAGTMRVPNGFHYSVCADGDERERLVNLDLVGWWPSTDCRRSSWQSTCIGLASPPP